MTQFKCTVCDQPFDAPSAALEQFPGWEPKYCREHSPKKKGSGDRGAPKKKAAAKRRSSSASKEENLNRAERIDRPERRTHLLFFPEIDLDGLDLLAKAFLGDEHAHETRAGRCGAIIELHGDKS